MPPPTTKSSTNTNLKTKITSTARKSNCIKSNNQEFKEETLIQTGRRGRDGQLGWRGLGWGRWWLVDQVVPYLCADKLGETTWGARQTTQPRFPGQGNKASKPLIEKTCGGLWWGEAPSLTGEFVGDTHRVLEHTQTHSPRNQHQKGPICLWVAEEVTESWQRAEQVALFPLWPLPHIQHHNTAKWVALPCQTPKALSLTTYQAC